MSIEKKILQWFISGDTGTSSKAMAAIAAGIDPSPHRGIYTPSDPDDFNRCLKLINEVPEVRDHMDKIAALSDNWRRLVDRWDEVEQMFLDEVGIDGEKGFCARKTYDLMKEIGC